MKKHLLGYVLLLGLLLSSPLRAFISPDPEGHVASMGLYSYCNGDPVNAYDPDGRFGKGVGSGWNGSISSTDPSSTAFYAGNLLGGIWSGEAIGVQNGAGGAVNALSFGTVSGALGSDSGSSQYNLGRNTMYGGMAALAAVGTGGLALEAAGGTAGLYTTLTTAANSPLVLSLGGATAGGGATAISQAEQHAGVMTENGFVSSIANAPQSITVSRWGGAGLQSGNWIMNGSVNLSGYIRSFKWEPPILSDNQPASFSSGRSFEVLPSQVKWPTGLGIDGVWKGMFGQRIYQGPNQ
jgi:hypothetical protein